METINIEHYTKLLDEFSEGKPLVEDPRSFLEIAGVARKENTISRILKYYFNTRNPHGLSNLLTVALLNCTNVKTDEIKSEIQGTNDVATEVRTDLGHRIDLVIEFEGHIICVENKLYSGLNNDLEHYGQFITKKHSHCKPIFILLSIFRHSQEELRGFLPVLYCDFANEIQKLLPDYREKIKPNDLVHLQDLINTFTQYYSFRNMDLAKTEFLIKNLSAFKNLKEEYDQLEEDKFATIKGVMRHLESNNEYLKISHNIHEDDGLYLYFDFPIKDKTFHITFTLDFNKVAVYAGVRKEVTDLAELKDILETPDLVSENGLYFIYRADVLYSKFRQPDQQEAVNQLKRFLDKFIAASNAQ